jgi:flagellar protein FlgJ
MSDPVGRAANAALNRTAEPLPRYARDDASRRAAPSLRSGQAEPPSRRAAEPAGSGKTPREKLQQASHDLEGLFVNELFKAMRASLPQGDGILGQAPGQDMFQGMMDEKLAATYATKSAHGIGEALYRQLSRRLTDGSQP